MDETSNTLEHLFEQLGLAADEASIEAFIASHSPLPEDVKLADAPFWSSGQSQFLKEKLLEDGSWAIVIDELNLRLHQAR